MSRSTLFNLIEGQVLRVYLGKEVNFAKHTASLMDMMLAIAAKYPDGTILEYRDNRDTERKL
jgi:hypothetical protein